MKKLFFIPALVLILMTSCTSSLVVGTVWTGDIKIQNKNYDLEIFFKPNNESRIYVTGDFNLDMVDDVAYGSGSHLIGSNNQFTGYYYDFDILGVTYRLKMTGVINYTEGSGYGDYTIKLDGVKVYDDEWKINKVSSN